MERLTRIRFREERGLALVETAIVILLLLFVTFAMMEFGWLLHRIQQGDATADGYYVDLFWSPTGEGRSYKASDGSFGSIRPTRPRWRLAISLRLRSRSP